MGYLCAPENLTVQSYRKFIFIGFVVNINKLVKLSSSKPTLVVVIDCIFDKKTR